MHYFEEEYQRRFKDAESTTGVDPDQLWLDIAGELPPENKGRRRILLWLLLLLLCSGVGVGAYSYWGVGDQSSAAELSPTTKLPVADAPTAEERVNYDNTALKEIEEEPLTNVPSQAEVDQGSAWQNAQSQPINAIKQLSAGTSDEKAPAASNDSTTPQFTEHFPTNKRSEQGGNLEQSKPAAQLVEAPARVFDVSPFLTHERKLLEVKQEVVLPEVRTATLNSKKSKQSSAFDWGISSAILSWNDHFKGQSNATQFGATLSDSHRAKGGFGIGLRIQKPLKGPWSLSTGLDFQQLYNTFEWSRNWDTVMYRNEVPGSDLINAEGTRNVRHQNELQVLHMPILLGYEGGNAQFSLGVQAGLGLNVLLAQSGRTLREEIIVQNFSGSEGGPYGRFFPSVSLSPYLGYQLSEHTQLRMQGQFRYQWHGQSDLYQLKHQSLLAGGAVSVLFNW